MQRALDILLVVAVSPVWIPVLLAALILQAETDEKAQLVLDLANTLRVAQQGTTITLRGEISSSNFDRILGMLPKQ